MVELVDSLDSGSSVHSGRAGSTPASRTKMESLETSTFQGFSFISNGLRASLLFHFWTECSTFHASIAKFKINNAIENVFEWLWFDFPTPFVKGDIVYDPCRTRLGPLCSGPFVMSDEGALGRLTEQHKARLKESGDTTDMCTGGYFQDEDGGLYYETSNSNYMDLEYCPEELLTGVKRIQIALGNFLKGKIDIDLLVRAYHQIRAQESCAKMPFHSEGCKGTVRQYVYPPT